MNSCETSSGVYIGPASVLEAFASMARVRIGEEERWALIALASPYQLAPGDTVVVLAQEDRCYVTGVLRGTGPTVFRFPGDVELQAPRGSVRVTAGNAVDLRGREVGVDAERVEVRARTLVERVTDAFRYVQGLVQTHAGRVRTVVEETHHQEAGRQVLLARQDVRIDGEQIRLG